MTKSKLLLIIIDLSNFLMLVFGGRFLRFHDCYLILKKVLNQILFPTTQLTNLSLPFEDLFLFKAMQVSGSSIKPGVGVFAIGTSLPHYPSLAGADVPRPSLAAIRHTPAAGDVAELPHAAIPRVNNLAILLPNSTLKTSRSEKYANSFISDVKSGTGSTTMKKCGFSIDDILHSSSRSSSPPQQRCLPSPELRRKSPPDNAISPRNQQTNIEFFARLQSKFYQDLKLNGLQLSSLRPSSNANLFSLSGKSSVKSLYIYEI